MNRVSIKLVVPLLVVLVTDPAGAQGVACNAEVMRLHVYHLPAPVIEKSKESHDAVFDDLRQRFIDIRWDAEELRGQPQLFGYLDGLELRTLPEGPPRSRRGYDKYFVGDEHAQVLQTVAAFVQQQDRTADYHLEVYLGRSNCDADNCYFRHKLVVPPPHNRDLIVNYYVVLTLYALSIDAALNCSREVAEVLRKAAITQIEKIEAKNLGFRRMCEVKALLGATSTDCGQHG